MPKQLQNQQKTICKYCFTVIRGGVFHIKAHLFKHNIISSRFKCQDCSKTFFRKDAYKKHVKKHIKKNENDKENSLICDYCKQKFDNKLDIIRHIKVKHEGKTKANSRKHIFSCVACKKKYYERRLLLHHLRREHFSSRSVTEPTHFTKSINESWVERSKDGFVQIKKVNNNVMVIEKCMVKPESFERKTKKEQSKDLPNKCLNYSIVICDYCKKQMLKKSLIKHIRERHLRIKKHYCHQCCKSFSRHYIFTNHKCEW